MFKHQTFQQCNRLLQAIESSILKKENFIIPLKSKIIKYFGESLCYNEERDGFLIKNNDKDFNAYYLVFIYYLLASDTEIERNRVLEFCLFCRKIEVKEFIL